MLLLESPAQKKAREDKEAMGGYWAGIAPTVVNTQVYTDFILSQIKVRARAFLEVMPSPILADDLVRGLHYERPTGFPPSGKRG